MSENIFMSSQKFFILPELQNFSSVLHVRRIWEQ